MVQNRIVFWGLFSLFGLSGCTSDQRPIAVAPFSSNQAREYQKITANDLHETIEKDVDLEYGVSMSFMLIPAGEFTMGILDNETWPGIAELPRHRVRISHPFWMGKYEVTQQQWKAVMGSLPSGIRKDELAFWERHDGLSEQQLKDMMGYSRISKDRQNPDFPVSEISWAEANQFCQTLSTKLHRTFRMPTEAEWEYACRAGTETPFYTGDNLTKKQANFCESPTEPNDRPCSIVEVGLYPPNPWGLYDMLGNVSERCSDWFVWDTYCHRGSLTIDPTGSKNSEQFDQHVERGGDWDDYYFSCSCGRRLGGGGEEGTWHIGFRVVMEYSEK
jgi:formylglycine-generating enzyme required for sulfatase activity